MKPDRSTQQVPEMLEREEMSSTSSTELQLLSPQRSPCKISEVPKWSLWCCFFYTDATTLNSGGPNTLEEEQQQEDRPLGMEKIFFYLKFFIFENEKFQLLNFHDMNCNKTLNLHFILNPINSRAIYSHTENMTSVKHKKICMFRHILTTTISWTDFTKLFLSLPSVKNNSHLHSMIDSMSSTANIEDLLAARFLPNYSPFDFSTVNLRQTSHSQKSILWLKDCFKKLTNCDKMELFHFLMKLFPKKNQVVDAVCEDMYSHLKPYLQKHRGKEKQYAFAVVLMKNGEKEPFSEVYPHHPNKESKNSASSSTENTKHSEEILIGQIDEFLQNHGTKAQSILIYTLNSPCLKREKDIVPCMFQLLYKAYEWHERYEVFTDVAFTKSWGLSGPNYFKYLKYSIVSCPSSDFYPYIEKCKDHPFKLDQNNLMDIFKKSDIFNTLSHVKENDKNTLRRKIKSARETLVSLAQSSSGLCNDHLHCGKQTINSFIFLPAVHDNVCEILQKEWNEMVNNSSMAPIREDITKEFNGVVVHLFREQLKSFLGSSSPLWLHRIPRMWKHTKNRGRVKVISGEQQPPVASPYPLHVEAQDLTFSNSPSPSSDFYPYIETCEKISFKLDSKDFREDVLKSGIYKAIEYVEAKDRR